MFVVPVVLAVFVLPSPALAAAAGPAPQNSQQEESAPPPAAPQTAQPPAAPAPPASADDLFSIEHIRRELERPPSLTFTMPDPNVPRYRVEIQGKKFQLPTLGERLSIPKSPVQIPWGGTERADMMRLNTPPEFSGSAPFTNGDLLKMSALTGAYGLAAALVKKAIEARASAADERERAAVQQELAEVAAHNARVAAGDPDPDGASAKAAAAEKKKQDKKKKQDEKKKKKDDGGNP